MYNKTNFKQKFRKTIINKTNTINKQQNTIKTTTFTSRTSISK